MVRWPFVFEAAPLSPPFPETPLCLPNARISIPSSPTRRIPTGARNVSRSGTRGCTFASVAHADTSAAATTRRTSTRRSIFAPRSTRSSRRSSPARTGAGATSTRSRWSFARNDERDAPSRRSSAKRLLAIGDVTQQREHFTLIVEEQRGAARVVALDADRQHIGQDQLEHALVGVVVADVDCGRSHGIRDQRSQCIALVRRVGCEQI